MRTRAEAPQREHCASEAASDADPSDYLKRGPGPPSDSSVASAPRLGRLVELEQNVAQLCEALGAERRLPLALSSVRVSRCVFGLRKSCDGSRPVRRCASFVATSLKPGAPSRGFERKSRISRCDERSPGR
jgi:hypothetical protein